MRDSIDPKWPAGGWRTHLAAVAAIVSGALVAGCGGSSPSPTAATVGGATHSGTTARVAGGSGPLAFAECMRSNGVPNFPDPQPGGGARFAIPIGIDQQSPAYQAAQAKCQKLLGGGSALSFGAQTHPSRQTLAKLLKIAVCMRQHGVPQFPDPTTSIPSKPPAGTREITNFDNAILVFPATINVQAPAYRKALTACGAPPLGLPH